MTDKVQTVNFRAGLFINFIVLKWKVLTWNNNGSMMEMSEPRSGSNLSECFLIHKTVITGLMQQYSTEYVPLMASL